MSTDEMVLSNKPSATTAEAEKSTVKTVLVHIQDAGSAVQRIESALAIARAHSAHVTCLQVTPVEAYVAFENFGGVFVMNDVMKAIDEQAERLRETVEKELDREDVSWDFIQSTGTVVTEIASHAALADIVVTGREPRQDEFGVPSISFLGDLLHWARTPLFIPGSAPVDPAGPAVVAWNGSYEAANAVRASLGLLKLASRVRVLNVTETKERSGLFPGTRLLEYLSRQGIHAELIVESSPAAADDDFVAGSLIAHSRSEGAYVVMGGYSRSRVKEFLFGGVTRTMLRDTTVPLVIAR